MSRFKLKLSKEQIVDMYIEGYTLHQIAKICECNHTNIHNLLKRLGIKCRKVSEAKRLYRLDETVFEVIDTEEKAYFLGFFYADGYNNRNNNVISIRLNQKDFLLLESFRVLLDTNRPLHYYKHYNSVDLTINSKKISQDLEKLGCFQAKSHILKFPTEEQVPNHLIRHFIRGYFDGDGCIYIGNILQTNKKCYNFTIAGLLSFLKDIQCILITNCNIKETKMYPKRESIGHGTLRYSGRKSVIKIFKYLYDDSNIYLNRKYQKFLSIPI